MLPWTNQRSETFLPERTLHPNIDSLDFDFTLTSISHKPFRIPVLLTIKWRKWSWNGLGSSLLERWIQRQAEPSRNLKIRYAWYFPFGNTPQGRFPRPLSFSRKVHLHALQPRYLTFKPGGSAKLRGRVGKDVPDTPSPKKNKVGGSGNLRYGRIAWDLSCPNPLQNKRRNENPSEQHCRPCVASWISYGGCSPWWVSELDLPFPVRKDGHIIRDYFNFCCSFISNEIREHCTNERSHSARKVWMLSGQMQSLVSWCWWWLLQNPPRNDYHRDIIAPAPIIELLKAWIQLDI